MCGREDDSLAGLFVRYHRVLVAYLTRMTRCPQRAEDLAQVTWVKLLGAGARGACAGFDEREMRAYLFTVARNAFLDEYTRKHEAVRTRAVDPALLDALTAATHSAPGPDEALERHQTATRVRAAIGALPVEQRRVILMWVRGSSIKDMAAACHAPTDTVLSRKKYGFARLRSRLADAAPTLLERP